MSPVLSCRQTKCRTTGESPVVVDRGRMRTKPLIPEMCFATTTEEDSESEKPPATAYLEEDGTSLLISCSTCSIRVHSSQSYTQIHCCINNAIHCHYPVHCYSATSKGPWGGQRWPTQTCITTVGVTKHCPCVCVSLCFRLLRCGSSHRQQGLEVCALQG